MSAHQRGHMSPTERKEVRDLYASGKYSLRALAKTYGVSHTTIKNIVIAQGKRDQKPITPEMSHEPKSKPKPKSKSKPKSKPNPTSDLDALQLRVSKLGEVEADILLARSRGSVHVLPQLHRLHVQLHDDLISLKKEHEEVGEMSVEGLIHSIVTTVSTLPPIVRHQILDHLEGLERGNLIRYPAAGDD